MRDQRTLVLGTHNRKKLAELVELLEPHEFRLRSVSEYPDAIVVEESGSTFTENAALKACEQARRLHAWVLGEDSGLLVDALDGAPGVHSARYSGPAATDASNNQKLLEALADVPWEKRNAHYVCHMCLSDPQGVVRIRCQGECHGRIRFEPGGQGGFGYDPLFDLLEYHQTFGELSSAVKGVISHRSRAVRLFVPALVQLVATGGWPVSTSFSTPPAHSVSTGT
ncbi:MAG: RdgB/HAM1 family non-canonical purine NTP pyrophosphatase [Planctomycetes bacterium]|nr:RdgB/HAM1 family non-canonical purine NTP pyrophosphatase [Planctomycetota bacterium]